MTRINEHKFELNNEEYLLTWYDKPRLTRGGVELKVLPILREYILKMNLPSLLFNSKGNKEVTNIVAKKILEHFSQGNSNNKSIISNTLTLKTKSKNIKEKSKIKNENQEKFTVSKNFKVVMICAGKKNSSFFLQFPNVNFEAISNQNNIYLPDSFMPNTIMTWRDYLRENQSDETLLSSYSLYKRSEYQSLYHTFGNSFYILSAGWGLVNSEYRLPKYDITFSSSSQNKNAIRKKKSVYKDFNQFYDEDGNSKINEKEDIIYIGGEKYLTLFYKLTKNLLNRKIIYFYGNKTINNLPNSTYLSRQYFPDNPNNNRSWHYELAQNIADCNIP